jgi:hypothetical protein
MKNRIAAGCVVLIAACGDNLDRATPDAAPDAVSLACSDASLPADLAAVADVTNVDERPCGDYVVQPARCFVITFDQPVRHGEPAGQHFGQKLWLVHRSCDAPMLVADWGYSQDVFFDDELSQYFGTNELWIEHRFQGESVPAAWDWPALTIENGARDMHAIIESFRTLYHGRWVSTGASKGGITATYHRYFFNDDLDGSIPYVAPASRSRVDGYYQTRLAQALPAACGQKVRDFQVAALTTRRSMMLSHLTQAFGPGYETTYLEVYIARFDWAFWQTRGAPVCGQVPTAAATDDAFWAFFAQFLPVGSPAPATNAEYSNGSLEYEWLTEHGFALQVGPHVQPLLTDPNALASMEDNFRGEFPGVELPAYNGSTTVATRAWVHEQAKDMLFIYGEFDPWSGGAMDAPLQPSSAQFFVPAASHGSAQIGALPSAQRIDALAVASHLFGRPATMAHEVEASRAAAVRAKIIDEKLMRTVMRRR